MKTILDELQFDVDGNIDLGIIPAEDVSSEPDLLVTLNAGTQPWHVVKESSLSRLAAGMGLAKGSIKGIVHGGGTAYTVITEDENYIEVDASEGEIEQAISEIVQVALTMLKQLR